LNIVDKFASAVPARRAVARQFLQQHLGSHVNSLRTFVLQENFPMANGAAPELIRGTPVSFSKSSINVQQIDGACQELKLIA